MLVQMAFHTNILSAVNRFRSLGDMFNGPEAADELVGKPDFCLHGPPGKSADHRNKDKMGT